MSPAKLPPTVAERVVAPPVMTVYRPPAVPMRMAGGGPWPAEPSPPGRGRPSAAAEVYEALRVWTVGACAATVDPRALEGPFEDATWDDAHLGEVSLEVPGLNGRGWARPPASAPSHKPLAEVPCVPALAFGLPCTSCSQAVITALALLAIAVVAAAVVAGWEPHADVPALWHRGVGRVFDVVGHAFGPEPSSGREGGPAGASGLPGPGLPGGPDSLRAPGAGAFVGGLPGRTFLDSMPYYVQGRQVPTMLLPPDAPARVVAQVSRDPADWSPAIVTGAPSDGDPVEIGGKAVEVPLFGPEEDEDGCADSACCRDVVLGDRCFEAVQYAMHQGILMRPELYPGLSVRSPFQDFQALLYRQGRRICPRPCAGTPTAPPPGVEALRDLAGHVPRGGSKASRSPLPPTGRRKLTLYMYRAEDGDPHHPTGNMNAGDLAAVLGYVHRVVAESGVLAVSRIRRFKVTMQTTWEFFNIHRRQFGAFVEFRDGRCELEDCDRIWDHYGFIVGCDTQPDPASAYLASSRTTARSCASERECNATVWYSLPGPCPALDATSKTPECVARMQGGLCGAVTGTRECTYSIEEAGFVGLDELTGAGEQGARQEEHDGLPAGLAFWDGRRDPHMCGFRLARLKRLFQEKYPTLPGCDELPAPPCDFDFLSKEELTWPVYSEPLEAPPAA